MIPKNIVQTSRQKPQEYIVEQIKSKSSGWAYFHYDDREVIQFFLEHPLLEFPNVVNKFFSFSVYTYC